MAEINISVETTNPAPAPRKLEVPDWAQAIKRKFLSQNVSQFILHGNINDYIRITENGNPKYLKVRQFLSEEMFRYKDIVVYLDRASGIRFKDDRVLGGQGLMRQDFMSTLQMFDELSGTKFSELTNEPARAFQILDTYFNLCLNQEFIKYLLSYVEQRLNAETKKVKTETVEREQADFMERIMKYHIPDIKDYIEGKPNDNKAAPLQRFVEHFKARLAKPTSIAFVVDFAETIIPMSETANSRPEERTVLVFLQKWATEDKFLHADMSVYVLTENAIDINQQYVKNPYTFEVNLPYPDETDRFLYIQNFFTEFPDSKALFEMSSEVLAKNTAGLRIVQLKTLLKEAKANQIPFTNKELIAKKKEMIESESGGLLEFIQTKYNLESVAGHKYAKRNLMEAAAALKAGRPDVMPMGYLVSGPVGTGKTYLISCFANDIGVPMVMLKNFRSQWQGVTEGNLEKVLKILKAMSPVAVMIDEADAYLGNRNSGGDSGVSSRVFSMIATFMSNTENRGKVVWFLITARPDLMPVDFKRQGRAEEHIALFYPESLEEKKELLAVMLKKTDLTYVDLAEFDEEFFEDMTIKSGADMEAALTRAKFKAASLGIEKVNFDIISQVFNDFLPPTYPEEIELMNYAAVLECTSKELLPEHFRNMSRDEVLAKVEELKMRVR